MISIATLSTYTGSTDTTLLTQIRDGWLVWLQSWIPRYLGVSATLTETQDGPKPVLGRLTAGRQTDRRRAVWLGEAIAEAALVSVKYRSALDSTWADLAVDAAGDADLTQFEIRPWAPWVTVGYKLVYKNACFPQGTGNLQVKYTHGYVEDSGPADVTQVLLQLVKQSLSTKKNTGVESRKRGTAAIKYSQGTAGALLGSDTDLLLSLKRGSY